MTQSSKSKKPNDGFLELEAEPPTKGKTPTRFVRVYTNLGDLVIPEFRRIDLVLIHPKDKNEKKAKSIREKISIHGNIKLREMFENKLICQGFKFEENIVNDKVYKKFHCPFERLCVEAETANLKMPLLGLTEAVEKPSNSCLEFFYNTFLTDKCTSYPISHKFMVDSIHLFENHHDPQNFFRPSVRKLLVDHILTNINIRDDLEGHEKCGSEDILKETLELSEKNKEMRMMNFHFMEKIGLYTDKMILHEVSEDSNIHELNRVGTSRQDTKYEEDPRKALNDEWIGFFKLQPMTKIRDYFGENIAFYFAWSGFLVTTLWLPMLLGLAIFIYGIHKSASIQTESSRVFTEACDNDVTPFYALIICLWGTFFLKLWKRQTATLASQWEVDEFAATEPVRPEFYGTKQKQDLMTGKIALYFPIQEQLKYFVVSGLTVVFMLCVVLASVIGVIVYRVFVSIDYCSSNTAEACVLVTTIVSSLLNTISILILSKLYTWLARKLTIWENHRTQTSFNNALIIKMFAFEFVNNYSSCFYIAFFRGRFGEEGIFGLGGNYPDSCEPDGNCMPELTFQILILTICKPLPKFFIDVVWLWIQRLWIKRPQWCWNGKDEVKNEFSFIQIESLKPSLDDFTMAEYTEKIIQYGFLMLFAASLPIAPLIVIITNLIDMRIDAYRLLWLYRRPVAKRAQDIGIWYIILQFVNIFGVISNGCLISLTSSWGRQYNDYTRLWIVVGFEHIVFALQFILAYLIPDVPSRVKLHLEKSKYRITEVLKYDRDRLEEDLSDLIKGNAYKPRVSLVKELPSVYDFNKEIEKTGTLPNVEEELVGRNEIV